MIYEEDYMKCESLDELENKVQTDTIIATIIGDTDRIKIIKQSAEKVAKLKFKAVNKQ